ncbi:hypothetical protein E1B28_011357 [Marasmius oreades]|uniref:Uncharacterized protein n=1 Tax=Marasmius oreades TaxID=181124 RepID=A0A9P7UPH4_9AGAR|nr:uncharacterized protein E1B28_011357 [Marasmius oreades]KAG7089702.1 hypothetical protein E1B28_011357 [Marasmius oreades]
MLRCLQLTIRITHGPLSCFPKSVHHDAIQSLIVGGPSLSCLTGNSRPVNERTRVSRKRTRHAPEFLGRPRLHTDGKRFLKNYLEDTQPCVVAPQTVIGFYNDLRTTCLTPKHMSVLIGIFGALSLPPGAPRITNRHVAAMRDESGNSYWDVVKSLVLDKQSLDYPLSDGDRYWIMWARLVDVENMDRESDYQAFLCALEDATYQFRQIWRQTKNPDILAPYFNVLLSLAVPQYLSVALELLSDLLALHRNIHPGLIRIVWKFLLLNPETLSSASRQKLLSVLLDRARVHPHPSPGSRSLSTHRFDPLTERHERLPLDTRQLVALLTAPLFPMFFIPGPSSVMQWATSLLRTSLSPKVTTDLPWQKMSLLALCHSCTQDDFKVSSWEHSSSFSDWDAILILHSFEHVISKKLSDHNMDAVRTVITTLWERWKEIPCDGRPAFVARAFVAGCLRLAGRIGDLDLCNDGWRYCAQHGLLLSADIRTKAERFQLDSLTNEYAEAFLNVGGGRASHILNSLNSSSQTTFTANANATLAAFVSRDVAISYDFYTCCLQRGISISLDLEEKLVIELARFLPSAAIPFLKKYERQSPAIESLLGALLQSLWTHRRQYIDPKQGSVLAGAMAKVFQVTVPPPTLRLPIGHAALLLLPHNAEQVVHLLELILKTRPTYFTPRLVHRLLQVLIYHRGFRLAVRLHCAIRKAMPQETKRNRRILFLGLVRHGANKLAGSLRTRVMCKRLSPSRRSTRYPSRLPVPLFRLHLQRIACALVSHRSTRINVWNFLFTYTSYLSTRTKMVLGNKLLDLVLRSNSSGRPISRVARTRRFLFRHTGFSGDRVTLNIFVKALLKSHDMDAFGIRSLFDYLIRLGYPASTHWLRSYGVPFGTPPTSPPFDLSFHKTHPIRFERHTRPLYKMFIKAFHLRNDISGAKTVIGILRGEEVAFLTMKSSARKRNL